MPSNDVNAPNVLPKILQGLGFDQKLNKPIPQHLKFTNEKGQPVLLKSYFGKRPVVLALVYYGCPNICTLTLNSIFKSIEKFDYTLGKDFDLMFVSIDPQETSTLAFEKKINYLKKYVVPNGDNGIHFLTGTQENIIALAESVGFKYTYEEKSKQYVHPSGVISISPNGNISTYIYGIDFPRKDLRLAIVQASENKIGRAIDKFLLFCYHYDPTTGRFGLMIINILRILAAMTVAGLLFTVLWLKKHENKMKVSA